MNFKRTPLRWTFLVAAVAGTSIVSGCVRERHLLGEAFSDASAKGSPGGAAGAVDAGGTGTDAINDRSVADRTGSPAQADASLGVPTVVSLGNQTSGGWAIAIPPQEVARRLSQFVLRKPASAALTAAVNAAAPKTNQDVGQLTDGLLLDESSMNGRQAFYRWWLGLDDFAIIARDPTLFPALTNDTRRELVDQTLAFVEDITWRPQGDLATLLTEPAVFATPATAPWFQGAVVPDGATATRVMLDATRHAGIVTQPAVVATADFSTRANPSGRGTDVRTRYLCQPLPPHPPSVPPSFVQPGVSTRQSLESIIANPACAACHVLIDSPGFAFGHFDAVGAYRDTEDGLAVDTTGLLTSTSAGTLLFDGPVALAIELANLPEVRTCYAIKWLAFVSGQFDVSAQVGNGAITDAMQADADYVVQRATIQGRLNLRGTLRAVTETHTFLDP